MDHEQEAQPQEQPSATQPEAPPFDPDPRLVTYLERGAKHDAEKRFRADLERQRLGGAAHDLQRSGRARGPSDPPALSKGEPSTSRASGGSWITSSVTRGSTPAFGPRGSRCSCGTKTCPRTPHPWSRRPRFRAGPDRFEWGQPHSNRPDHRSLQELTGFLGRRPPLEPMR